MYEHITLNIWWCRSLDNWSQMLPYKELFITNDIIHVYRLFHTVKFYKI